MLNDDLELLEPPVPALRLLVEVAPGRFARALLGLLLIGAAELIDLLPKATDVPAKRVDDRVEEPFELIARAGETGGVFRARKYRLRDSEQYRLRRAREDGPSHFDTAQHHRIAGTR